MKIDELVKGSFILIIMMGIFNLLNYIFQFSMIRLLGPADYSILAVLMSLVYIFSIPSEAIQTVVTRYTSRFNIKKELGKIKDLMYRGMKKGFKFSIIVFIFYIPFAFFLSQFLNINLALLIATGLIIFFVFLVPITRGVIQGRKKFSGLGWNLITESSIKLLFAMGLVILGFGVYGPIIGIIAGSLVAFISSFFIVREIIKNKKETSSLRDAYSYSLPIFVSMVSIVLMYSLDVIFAKRFFPSDLAGKYSALSMFGKIILFGTIAVSKTMFPITSESFEKGEETKKLFYKSLKIVISLSLIALIIFGLFPNLIIKIIAGSVYTGVSNLLFIVSLSFALLSVSNLIILYGLSINKIKKSSIMLLAFVILQVVLFSIFHSNLLEFALAFLTVNTLMLIYSIFMIKR